MSRVVDEHHPLFDRTPRMLGFAALAAASGGEVQATTVRGYYLKDLRRGDWVLLPAPDVLLLRTEGNPLPGWTRETAGLWLRQRRARAA